MLAPEEPEPQWDANYFSELTGEQASRAILGVSYTPKVLHKTTRGSHNTPLDGCQCSPGPCVPESCSCVFAGQVQAYDSFSPNNISLIECGDRCSCSLASCANRATQQEENRAPRDRLVSSLRLFWKNAAVGFGVKTIRSIGKGAFVVEYTGELVSFEEVNARGDGATTRNYTLVLKENIPKHDMVLCTCVDASAAGNVSRFINHSCEPNLEIYGIRVDFPIPRLCLFASRDIVEGEELTISYGTKLGSKPCLCQSKKCLRYLPFE